MEAGAPSAIPPSIKTTLPLGVPESEASRSNVGCEGYRLARQRRVAEEVSMLAVAAGGAWLTISPAR